MKRSLYPFMGLMALLGMFGWCLPVLAQTSGGVNIRSTGGKIVFRRAIDDSSGVIVTTGTTTLQLYELQDDGSLKSYDFADNTFKVGALTTETVSMTNRSGNNGTTATGLWTYSLGTVTGFVKGKVYIAVTINALGSPARDRLEFQYGGADGDLSVDANGNVGLKSGAVSLASLHPDVAALFSRCYLISAGTTTPASADQWAVGGLYNGVPYYASKSTGLFAWNNGTIWIVSSAVGTTGTTYWSGGANVTSTYTAAGASPPTGVVAFAAHGNAMLNAFQPGVTLPATDASGRLTLTPTEHGLFAGDIFNAQASSYNTALSLGAKLNAAGSASDPLANALSGYSTAGTAGYLLNRLLGMTNSSGQFTSTAFGLLPNVNVGGYATGQDPATLLYNAVIDGSITGKQAQALQLATLSGKYSVVRDTVGKTLTTTYKRQDGTTTLAVSVVSYADSALTQPTGRTLTFSNLP